MKRRSRAHIRGGRDRARTWSALPEGQVSPGQRGHPGLRGQAGGSALLKRIKDQYFIVIPGLVWALLKGKAAIRKSK